MEFANVLTGRHVWLSDPAEMAAVDAGSAGPGWARNGYYFDISNQYDAYRVDVCRFYSPKSNSHFFTANALECSDLRSFSRDWTYEQVAFRAYPPRSDGCGGAVYRLYNDRPAAPAHRFTTDRELRQRLVREGWVDEGTAWCVDGQGREIERSWTAGEAGAPRGDCDESAREGTCVMARSLPPLANSGPDQPGLYFMTRVGSLGTVLHTAQPLTDAQAVAANSFAQAGPGYFGFQLVGANRVGGPLATMGVVHVIEPERVFPWGDGRERDLRLSFSLYADLGRPLAAADPSQAYGLGVLRFRDRISSRALMVTLQAFGKGPPGNAVMRDAFTGQPIVSTFFSFFGAPSAAFGRTDAGSHAQCSDAIPLPTCFVSVRFSPLPYAFRIARADFVKIIAMAREVDPALSPDPADYRVSSFQFRGETYLDAKVAFSIYGLTLTLSK